MRELLDRATHTIVQQVEALKGMVNAFSEYARAPDLKLGRVDLNALVNEVVELYRAQEAGDHAAGGRRSAGWSRCRPTGAACDRCLNNLSPTGWRRSMACRAAGSIGHDAARAATGGGSVAVVTVSDNGHGFQKEMLARVFDPYVTSKPRGTGLGLAIVKKIAEEHGGRVEADNDPEGGARTCASCCRWLQAS